MARAARRARSGATPAPQTCGRTAGQRMGRQAEAEAERGGSACEQHRDPSLTNPPRLTARLHPSPPPALQPHDSPPKGRAVGNDVWLLAADPTAVQAAHALEARARAIDLWDRAIRWEGGGAKQGRPAAPGGLPAPHLMFQSLP